MRAAHCATSDAGRDECLVALGLELVGELRAAVGDDTPVDEDVHEVRRDVVEDALVVRDHERARLGADELVHAVRDDLERVDVETRVGLVEHGDLRLQHRHLQDLDALLLAAGEAVVQIPRRELARDLELLHRRQQVGAELGNRNRIVLAAARRLAVRVDRAPQEARHGDAGDRVRVLEGEEEAALRALVRAELGQVLAVEEDLTLGDLVRRMAHERVRERRLSGAVRAHDGVLLPEIDLEVDTLDDLGAVLQSDVQIPDLELSHAERRPPGVMSAGCSPACPW